MGPGSRFGPFEIVRELGRGGMGAVFVARDTRLQREVALKVMLASVAGSQEAQVRFGREARAAAQLQHPNIVPVYDVGWEAGHAYMVMDLIGGVSLSEQLARGGPLPPEEAARITMALARALDHAHEHGVVHRDIKPANVLLCEDGRPLITDFGIARDAQAERERLTQTGDMLGTPEYMSPEQADGDVQAIGPQTDVYALGATLYAMLVNRPPFQSDSAVRVITALLTKPHDPLQTIDPTLPVGLVAICHRCLEKEPADRYPGAGALAADLELFLAGEAVSARLPEPPRSGALAAGVLLLGVGALAVGVWLLARSSPAPAVVETPATSPEERGDDGPAGAPMWFRGLPAKQRPAWPLPRGIECREQPKEYRNRKDGSVLVWVPPGQFTMGRDRWQRRVTLRRGYFIGRFEVTWRQFRVFCKETGRPPPPPRLPVPGGKQSGFVVDEGHPVHHVYWRDAFDYARWAGLCLPSEVQWEYAARGHDGRPFPWGALDPGAQQANTRVAGRGRTSVVGLHPGDVSPFGCLDMGGNVSEWVLDRATPHPIGVGDQVDPPPAMPRPGYGVYVFRGGSFERRVGKCRVDLRSAFDDAVRSAGIGFRVAWSAALARACQAVQLESLTDFARRASGWNQRMATPWTHPQPKQRPPARELHSLVYDSARKVVLLFGGRRLNRRDAELNDLWSWNGARWRELAPVDGVRPPGRYGAAVVFDEARGCLVVFGGKQVRGQRMLGDLWEWDGSRWRERSFEDGPERRAFAGMAYDTKRRVTVLFGGNRTQRRVEADHWTWNGARWTQLTPGVRPPPRTSPAMGYDRRRDRVIVFGGSDRRDHWEWDGRTWREARHPIAPPAGYGWGLVWTGRSLLLTPGHTQSRRSLNQVWEWTGEWWRTLAPSRKPPPYVFSSAAYDGHRRVVVLFGGLHDRKTHDEVWEYRPPF